MLAAPTNRRLIDGMPRKKAEDDDDDRVLAFVWYARELLLEEIRLGATKAELARDAGLEKNQITAIVEHAQGFGWSTLLKVAPRLRRDEGAFVSEALTWWDRKGREVRAKVLADWAEQSRAAVDAAAKRSRSGQMRAVRGPEKKDRQG